MDNLWKMIKLIDNCYKLRFNLIKKQEKYKLKAWVLGYNIIVEITVK
jgi:hypothetical protein